MQCLSSSVRFISVSIIPPKSIHIFVDGKISFLKLLWLSVCVYIYTHTHTYTNIYVYTHICHVFIHSPLFQQYLFTFGCAVFIATCGLSLVVVPRLRTVVASLVSEHGLRVFRLQELWCMSLVAPWHVEFSQTRDGTLVPCIGRGILNHWTTR